jgi:hypothetical protein
MPGSYTSQPSKKLLAGEALAQYRLVTLTSNEVLLCDAANYPVGTVGVDGGVADAEYVDVTLANAPGTRLLTASAAITAGATVSWADTGKVVAYTNQDFIYGIALEAAAGDGAVIEVLPLYSGLLQNVGS